MTCSNRAKVIAYQESVVSKLENDMLLLDIDGDNDNAVEHMLYHNKKKILSLMNSKWFFLKRNADIEPFFDFDDCLSNDSTKHNDYEFLYIFSLQCKSFFKLAQFIKTFK